MTAVGDGAGMGLAASYRREGAPLTVKRGEFVLEDADVRREAWYGGGAEIVGDEEVSMSRVEGRCGYGVKMKGYGC
jgi:hypothetical protein